MSDLQLTESQLTAKIADLDAKIKNPSNKSSDKNAWKAERDELAAQYLKRTGKAYK